MGMSLVLKGVYLKIGRDSKLGKVIRSVFGLMIRLGWLHCWFCSLDFFKVASNKEYSVEECYSWREDVVSLFVVFRKVLR